MAVSPGAQAAMADDQPLILARNNAAKIRSGTTEPEWRNDDVNTWSAGSDNTATGFDTKRVRDGHGDSPSKPAVVGSIGSRALLFDLESTLTDLVPNETNTADMAIIHGHNFSQCGGLVDCFLESDSDPAFGTAVVQASTTSIAGDKRIVFLNFQGTFQFVAARYWRIRITSSTDFAGAEPEISEFYLGPRRQLQEKGQQPQRTHGQIAEQEKTRAKSGVSTTYVYNVGGDLDLPRTWRPVDGVDSSLYGLNDAATILQWHIDCDRFTKPFFYIEDPTTNPQLARFVKTDEATLLFDKSGAVLISFDTVMVEEAPYVDIEQRGRV